MTRTGTGMRVAVVGTGALGSALLQRLAAVGMRSVLLIDPDRVEPRNLPLSPFLQEALAAPHVEASGAPHKAALLAAHAWAAYRLPWRALRCDVASVGWQRLRACDLLCCCTDSALSRAELAFIARMLGKPVLDGAVTGQGIAEGRVTQFSSNIDAACYLCGLREERRSAVLGLAASAALGCHLPEEAAAMTGTRSSLDMVADRMVAKVIDLEEGGTWTRASHAIRLSADKPLHRTETVQLTRSETCPWHDDPSAELCSLPWQMPLRDSLVRLFPEREVLLDWPVCTEALCTICRRRCAPFQRVAVVRRSLQCLHCGALALQPLATVSRIRHADMLAARSPRQLGQPIRHLYRMPATADTLMCMNLGSQ